MTKELRAEWIAALRSGEYKQGRQYLRNKTDEYCCLGVLYQISNIDCSLQYVHDYGYAYKDVGYDVVSFPTSAQLKAFGLPPETAATLVRMNDTEKASFAVIADYIENADDYEFEYPPDDLINPPGDDSEQSGTE